MKFFAPPRTPYSTSEHRDCLSARLWARMPLRPVRRHRMV